MLSALVREIRSAPTEISLELIRPLLYIVPLKQALTVLELLDQTLLLLVTLLLRNTRFICTTWPTADILETVHRSGKICNLGIS